MAAFALAAMTAFARASRISASAMAPLAAPAADITLDAMSCIKPGPCRPALALDAAAGAAVAAMTAAINRAQIEAFVFIAHLLKGWRDAELIRDRTPAS
jgi:hypothetical protein